MASTTVASSAPGAMVSDRPCCANPARVSSSAGRHTNRPCSGAPPSLPGPPSPARRDPGPAGSGSSGLRSGKGSRGMHHRPFGLGFGDLFYKEFIITQLVLQQNIEHIFKIFTGLGL